MSTSDGKTCHAYAVHSRRNRQWLPGLLAAGAIGACGLAGAATNLVRTTSAITPTVVLYQPPAPATPLPGAQRAMEAAEWLNVPMAYATSMDAATQPIRHKAKRKPRSVRR